MKCNRAMFVGGVDPLFRSYTIIIDAVTDDNHPQRSTSLYIHYVTEQLVHWPNEWTITSFPLFKCVHSGLVHFFLFVCFNHFQIYRAKYLHSKSRACTLRNLISTRGNHFSNMPISVLYVRAQASRKCCNSRRRQRLPLRRRPTAMATIDRNRCASPDNRDLQLNGNGVFFFLLSTRCCFFMCTSVMSVSGHGSRHEHFKIELNTI